MCFARDETTRSLFHHFVFDADQMSETARQWLAHHGRNRTEGVVTASVELRRLLARAEAHAVHDGRAHASPHDVLGVLAEITAAPRTGRPSDLTSVPSSHASSQQARDISPFGPPPASSAIQRGDSALKHSSRVACEAQQRPFSLAAFATTRCPQQSNGGDDQIDDGREDGASSRQNEHLSDRPHGYVYRPYQSGSSVMRASGHAGQKQARVATEHRERAVQHGKLSLRALFERLDQQEAALAQLRAALGRTSSTPYGSSTDREERAIPTHEATLPDTSAREASQSRSSSRASSSRKSSSLLSGSLSTASTHDRVNERRRHRRQALHSNRRQGEPLGERHNRESWRRLSDRSRMPSNDDARPVTVISGKDRYDRVEDRAFDRDTVDPREKRFYLALEDEVVRAPSIGNKTASRLNDVGVTRVRDLLDADPDDLSQRLGVRHISPQRIREWQAQARLVCTVPWLRGTHAQLLVGAGFPTADEITGAEPGSVCAAILKFAMTRDGQSVLRSGPPPDVERITQWVEFAAQAEPARAA